MLKKGYVITLLAALAVGGFAQRQSDTPLEAQNKKKAGKISVSKKPAAAYYVIKNLIYSIDEQDGKPTRLKKIMGRRGQRDVSLGRQNIEDPKLIMFTTQTKTFVYHWADTPRVDSIKIMLYINKKGKVSISKWIFASDRLSTTMLKALEQDMTRNKNWYFTVGGRKREKKWWRKEKIIPKDFYCEFKMILSSYPLTEKQYTDELTNKLKREND